MNYSLLGSKNDFALLNETACTIIDVQSALDLILSLSYKTNCSKLIVHKSCFSEDFFVLSTGIAGEILQKFLNYQVRLAVVGDFSTYTSKPLRDFIYESNQGRAINFLSTVEDAIARLDQ